MLSLKRLGIFFSALLVGVVLWVVLLLGIFGFGFDALARPDQLPQHVVLTYTIGLYLWLMTLVLALKRPVFGLPAITYGFAVDAKRLFLGWVLGLGGVLILMALELGFQLVGFRAPATWPIGVLLGSVVAAFGFAISEELLFRGLFLRSLLQDHPPIRAIGLSSVLFAALHFIRPNLGPADLLPFLGLIIAGGVLAYAAYKTNSLWLSIGIHAGWVFFISVSNQLQLWDYAPHAIWLSGGAGPSSGVLGMVLLLSLIPTIKRYG